MRFVRIPWTEYSQSEPNPVTQGPHWNSNRLPRKLMICLGFRGRTAMLVLYAQTDRYGCKGRQRQPAGSNATMPVSTAANFYRDAVDRVRRDGFAVIGASCFRSRHGKRNHHRASELTMAVVGFAPPTIAQAKRRRRNGRRLFLNTNTSIPGATFDISSASSSCFIID